VRSFARTPGIALALLITIALGIGSNVTVYGFVRGLTKPPSPLTSVERVVSVFGREAHREAGPLSYPEYLSVKGRTDAFEWLGAARISQGAITLAGQSATVPVAAVTANLSSLLGLSPGEGVVIGQRMWQDEFGSKADVRGDPIRIDGVDTRVSGVAPAGLKGYIAIAPSTFGCLYKRRRRKILAAATSGWLAACAVTFR
jgi:putative ABC transport system permease protein